MDDIKAKRAAFFERFKYPLMILAAGVILMLLPDSGSGSTAVAQSDALVAHILSSTQGVGETEVLISDKGVIIVCEGADDAKVRLEIIRAVGSYTGYGSEKITILKMAD